MRRKIARLRRKMKALLRYKQIGAYLLGVLVFFSIWQTDGGELLWLIPVDSESFIKSAIPLAVKASAVVGGLLLTTIALIFGMKGRWAVEAYREGGQLTDLVTTARSTIVTVVVFASLSVLSQAVAEEFLKQWFEWLFFLWLIGGLLVSVGFLRVSSILFNILNTDAGSER